MYSNCIDCEIIEMTCRQLGAKEIRRIEGTLYYYEFDITDDCSLSYYFNVNDKNEFNLHRIKPYRFTHTIIQSEEEVINYIKADLARFRNAANSTNFKKFVSTVNRLTAIGAAMDDLFLNFNVDKESLADIDEQLKNITRDIDRIKNDSEEIVIEEE